MVSWSSRFPGLHLALLLCAPAHALQISSLLPEGERPDVAAVVARFDDAAIEFGRANAPAPLSIQCSDAQAARGSGRWISAREWSFSFEAKLPAGVRCTVQAEAGFRSPGGEALSGKTSFAFNTGGPLIRRVRPREGWESIDEEQVFVLELSGPADPASVLAHASCSVQGLGERVPVRLIDGAQRQTLLSALRLQEQAAKSPGSLVTLQCNRRFTPGSTVQLQWGPGIASPGGLINAVGKRLDFQVRYAFEASFSCERENAQAACLPVRPMKLNFNAPVARQLAEAITLRSAQQSLRPAPLPAGEAFVRSVSFPGPFAELGSYTLVLPAPFTDDAGRSLRNASSFPLKVATAAEPLLAKFAASPFGVIERLAEPQGLPLFPITVRRVEPSLALKGLVPGSRLGDLNPDSDAEIIRWWRLLKRYDENKVSAAMVRRDIGGVVPRTFDDAPRWGIESRMLSLLGSQPQARTLTLPSVPASTTPAFEVLGIPLSPGFHVLELASPKLGESLLDARHGKGRTMYVRSSALVTNLGVHFKLGAENALAWVTTLDRGQPVAGARVQVSDCRGRPLASGQTDARGLVELKGLPAQAPSCGTPADEYEEAAFFISARATDASGVADLAFTWSNWNRGIEPWRFNLPVGYNTQTVRRAHTILDRSLLRAGETISMKHVLRSENRLGLAVPQNRPEQMRVTHVGSGQTYTQRLQWRQTAGGGLSAESRLTLPASARLGSYQIELVDAVAPGKAEPETLSSGEFRVEAFRLPVLTGQIAPESKQALVQPRTLPVQVQVSYLNGGAAARLPVQVSALMRRKELAFAGYDDFSFQPPRKAVSASQTDEEDDNAEQPQRVVADKLPLTLDASGQGRVTLTALPQESQAAELQLEARYADPSGEIQTLRSTATLWPANVLAGIRTDGWVSQNRRITLQALALDTRGLPRAGVALQVRAQARITTSTRKRLVGGFYSYDNSLAVRDLGVVCSGTSDARGLLPCDVEMKEAGEIELVVTARDEQGLSTQAASSVWVTRQGELWFGSENTDRIDLLPEKKSYQPGEVARFQVRMPFRYATALVTVEREGIIDSRVVELNGQDPTVKLQVQPGWGPNVYVSVLALRGRLREVPWYSLFTWGLKSPSEWWSAWRYGAQDAVAPTALVDLSKPAYRLGVAGIEVGTQAHRLDVQVSADKASYPVRGTASVTVSARLPNGEPAAGAEVALVAVDQALLELLPNPSWNLLEAMLQRRDWNVATATAQMQIVGRRHYGRKAVPTGGSGGRSPTRELLETLLLWNPRVVLDARGQAVVKVPLNDALSSFRIVAVADAGTSLFGTGATSIRSTQDLQLISGLPPLVREGDRFRAQFTVRNTTPKTMQVTLTPRAEPLQLKAQSAEIAAGAARELFWDVQAPAGTALRGDGLAWELTAVDSASGARDSLRLRQRVLPAVPLTVQQATLVQLSSTFKLEVAAPDQALPDSRAPAGGLQLSLQPRLASGLPGVRDWFARYPYACLEQRTSKALGLADAAQWQALIQEMPVYLDSDGLAGYFAPREGEPPRGSDTLSAYLLAASDEAARLDPAFALPPEVRNKLENALAGFVEGRLKREVWSPRKDLELRKLAAIEALSRHGKAQPRMLQSIQINPASWPTSAVLDWLQIVRRLDKLPQREQRLAEALQILKGRLAWQGTRAVFSSEREDHLWWLMTNGDVNAARLLLVMLDEPAWQDDMSRLASGLISRQQGGAWSTTTANLWGSLALERFSRKFESAPVSGVTQAQLGTATASLDWSRVAPAAAAAPASNSLNLPWAPGRATLSVTQQGTGRPWLTLQALAAVAETTAQNAGYSLSRTVTPIEQAVPGRYTRGDIVRVRLQIRATADSSWVAITDPVPAGATILGSGLGRDSLIASSGEKRAGQAVPAFEERGLQAWRGYYDFLPQGSTTVEYTLRLNQVGDFALPPTRAEAMYAPEVFGLLPNARVRVEAAP